MTFSGPRHEPGLIIGYTTRSHLLLDLDDTTHEKVRRLAYIIMRNWVKLGDCLIVESSDKDYRIETKYSYQHLPYHKVSRPSYHLIFDNKVGYDLCMRACETLAELGVLNRDYVKIRTFRGDMTLRVSHQNMSDGSVKPAPIPVTRIYQCKKVKRDGMIEVYLRFLVDCRSLFPIAHMVPEVGTHGSADERLGHEQQQVHKG